MPDMLVRDVDAAVLEKLRENAVKNGRSLQSEVRVIISDYVNDRPLSDAEVAHKIKRALGGRKHSDSAALLRKDRRR